MYYSYNMFFNMCMCGIFPVCKDYVLNPSVLALQMYSPILYFALYYFIGFILCRKFSFSNYNIYFIAKIFVKMSNIA